MKEHKNIRHGSLGSSSMVEHLRPGDVVIDVIVIILVGVVAFMCIIPFWHVLMSSISDGQTLYAHEGMVWWPVGGITLDGFRHVFKNGDIVKGFFNSVFYTFITTEVGFLFSVTAGYALSRHSKLKKSLTRFIMVTMMFGGGMVPTYMVIKAIGWVGTPLAIILPGCTNAMFIIMMMTEFNRVPKEMYEAAALEGAGHFRTLFRIILPQAMNMGTVIIFNLVVGTWNSWVPASIYLTNVRDMWPLQLFIRETTANAENFLQSTNPDYSRYLIQYAVVIVSTLPIMVLFPFFQGRMERATIAGGVKG